MADSVGEHAALFPGLAISHYSTVIIDIQQDDQPLVYVNPAFERLTGYSADEVLGRPWHFLEGRAKEDHALLRRVLETGQPETALLQNRRKDGSLFQYELTLEPLHDQSGELAYIVGFQQDVTVREAAIQQAEQRLQITLNNLPEAFISYDQHWTITYVNAAGAAMVGRPAAHLIGQALESVFPDPHRSPLIQAAGRVMESRETEHVSTYSDVLSREVETTVYATDDGVALLLRDVTAQRRDQQELQGSQERFSKVFDASPLAIIITRLRDGQFVEANPAFYQLSGYTRDEVIGHTSEDLQLWVRSDQRADLIHILQEQQRVIDREVDFRLQSGEVRSTTLSMVPLSLMGEDCIVSLVRDVSEEKRTRQQLKISEQAACHTAAELQRTLDLSLDLITSIDAQGQFVTVNAASQRLLGYEPAELIGHSYLDFVLPDDHNDSKGVATLLREEKKLTGFQNRYLHRDGSVVWLDWTSVRLPDGLTYAVARDVTERRAATEDLAFLAAIVQASTNAIIGTSLDGTIRSWNGGAERMFGFPTTEMLGRRITELTPPELRESEAYLLAHAAQGVSPPAIETTRLTRSGTRIPVQLSIAPIVNAAGTVIGVSGIVQDISGRWEAERQVQLLNARLQRQIEHLTGLRQIDQAITSSLDLTVILGIVLDQVKVQLAADAVTVLLLDPHELTLFYAATRGFRTTAPQGRAVRLGEELAGRVALTRQPMILNHLQNIAFIADWRDLLQQEGLTAYAAVPLIAKGKTLGVIEVLREQPFDLTSDGLETLQTLAGQAAIAVDNAQLFLELERSNLELGLAYQETIEGWARALDLRDKETEGHSRRVTSLTVELCRVLGVSAADLVHVRRGALLHDIGKVGIADAILLKPGPLTAEEWVEMRQHPLYAVDLLSPIHFLQPALDIPQHHHERWDGSGSPQGLKGTSIPLTARAFAVVDVYDALTSDRPYRAAWPRDQALAHIQAEAGAHFDPGVVQAFLALHH
ncbi:PAS domain S-box protein [Deinococcus oregonensis]|uniref:PAS domain S-box protein n=1 Tax=Deinococcus oregonensis TaxID=1805970 RepID=A0ABV6B3Y8_9DEIO